MSGWESTMEAAARSFVRVCVAAACQHAAGNLPLQLTSFVGRDVEVAAFDALLGAHWLVTLTGAVG